MRWGYDSGPMKIEWTIDDAVIKNLPIDPEIGRAPTPEEIKQLAEFESFLMFANRFRMAVLDEQTLAFIIMNYDSQAEVIKKSFKDLAIAMAEKKTAVMDEGLNDNTSPNNSKE
jgi:hypothetical protein